MKKILIRIDISIGDTIAAVPYVEKFSIDHSEEKILFEINDNLIPLLSPIYPTITFVGRQHNENYDEKIEFRYDYGVSVQSGFAKQLGYDNPEYIRPKIINLEFQRPIKNKYITNQSH